MWTTFEDGAPLTRCFNTPFGPATRVTTASFVEHFLPRLSPGLEPHRMLSSIRRRRKFWKQLVTKDDRLWGYGKKTPSQQSDHRAYAQLQSCFTKLSTAIPGRNKLLKYHEKINGSTSSLSGKSPFPDGGLLLHSADTDADDAPWGLIAVSGVLRACANEGASRLVGALCARSRSKTDVC